MNFPRLFDSFFGFFSGLVRFVVSLLRSFRTCSVRFFVAGLVWYALFFHYPVLLGSFLFSDLFDSLRFAVALFPFYVSALASTPPEGPSQTRARMMIPAPSRGGSRSPQGAASKGKKTKQSSAGRQRASLLVFFPGEIRLLWGRPESSRE